VPPVASTKDRSPNGKPVSLDENMGVRAVRRTAEPQGVRYAMTGVPQGSDTGGASLFLHIPPSGPPHPDFPSILVPRLRILDSGPARSRHASANSVYAFLSLLSFFVVFSTSGLGGGRLDLFSSTCGYLQHR
jgi:hypothetical protein